MLEDIIVYIIYLIRHIIFTRLVDNLLLNQCRKLPVPLLYGFQAGLIRICAG